MAEWQCSECGSAHQRPPEQCPECGGSEFDHTAAIRLTGRGETDRTVGASEWVRYMIVYLLAAIGLPLLLGFLL